MRLPISSPCLRVSVVLLLAALFAIEALAQLPQARVTSVYPTGGQKGSTFDITAINGTDLEGLNKLYFSHPGIVATPKTGGQFTVSIAADVPAGIYDVRAGSSFGLSNPRSFVVGDREEANETEPNNSFEAAKPLKINSTINGKSDGSADVDVYQITGKAGQRLLADCRGKRIDSRMDPALELYNSAGRKLASSHNQIRRDALLDFTLPADGDYFLKVYDFVYAGGNDYFYRLTLHTGPHLDFILPSSGVPGTIGEYTLYGRNLPGGQPSEFKAGNRPLEQMKVYIALPPDASLLQYGEQLSPAEAGVDGVAFSLGSPVGSSNPVTIYFASSPTTAEREPNDAADKSQKLTLPVEVSGQFQTRGDSDWYTFDAKANEVYWLEVFGQRNGSPADPSVAVDQIKKNDKGEETTTRLFTLDDNPTNIGGNLFNTLTDDPVQRFVVPADGTYRVLVRDRYFESRGAPNLTYRLALRKETPDFRLVTLSPVPVGGQNPQQQQQQDLATGLWNLSLRKGDNAFVTVMAYRRDGFNGSVEISVEGLPAGVTCPGAAIAPGQAATTLVFSSIEQAAEWAGTIRIVGKARVEDPATKTQRDIAREARGGTIVWPGVQAQQVLPQSRLARTVTLTVLNEVAPYQLTSEVSRFDVNQSRQILIPLKLARRAGFDANVNLTFAAPPQNVQVENKPMNKGTDEQLYRLFVQNNAAPGMYTLYLQSQAQVSYSKGADLAAAAAKEKEAAEKAATAAAEAVKKAGEGKTAAEKKLTEAKAAVNTATAQLAAAENVITDTTRTAQAANDKKASADKQVAEKAAAVKLLVEEQAVVDKLASATDAAAKALTLALAEAKSAAEKSPQDRGLIALAVDLEKSAKDAAQVAQQAAGLKKTADEKVAEANESARKLGEAKATADKKASEASDAAKKAAEAKVAAEKAVATANAAVQTATTEKAAAEKAVADATDAAKKATDAKAAADKKATDTANAAKPQNINTFFPSTPIILNIKPGAGTLAVSAANNGAVKVGGKVDIKVTITRINGYNGPATLSLPLPPGVSGLTAKEVVIPADQKEATLTVEAAADAKPGQLANMVVRASMDFNGPAAIDQPVALSIAQ